MVLEGQMNNRIDCTISTYKWSDHYESDVELKYNGRYECVKQTSSRVIRFPFRALITAFIRIKFIKQNDYKVVKNA